MLFRRSFLAVLLLATTLAPSAGLASERWLILATTTSVRDSGLLDALLPDFTAKTGIEVRVIAVGTGAALRMGREGNADVLLTHAPAAEQVLVDEGIVTRRTPFMENFFVIAGPAEDPAAIAEAGSSAGAPVSKPRGKKGSPDVAPRDVAAAAALGQWRKIAEWLQTGGQPNAWYVSSWGTRWTLLMAAAAGNQALTIKMLVKVGAELDLVSEVGFSALMYAVRRGHLSAAEVLIDAGADAKIGDASGMHAFDLAVVGKHTNVRRALEPSETDRDARASVAPSALARASACGDADAIRGIFEAAL